MAGINDLILDFNGSYETIAEIEKIKRIDCSTVSGSRLICGAEAGESIGKMIDENGPEGIHFIDCGDYHYISKLMTDRIKEPFALILIDHHTDMQKPAFGGVLTCGDWAGASFHENVYLEKLILVGMEEAALAEIEPLRPGSDPASGSSACAERKCDLARISFETLTEKGVAAACRAEADTGDLPVYISIDKDVLDERYAITNWDQGNLSMAELKDMIAVMLSGKRVIGADICGGFPDTTDFARYCEARRVNLKSDAEIYEYLGTFF